MAIEFEIRDVILTKVTFTDLSEVKKRPVLIVEKLLHGDYLALPITSLEIEKINNMEKLISKDDFEEGQIPKISKVLLSKPYVVNESLLIKKYGKVRQEYFKNILKLVIFNHTLNYHISIHKRSQASEFIRGKSKIPYAGRVFDEKEMINLVDSSLDFWLTTGKYAEKFEKKFPEFLGVKYCSLTNSGSSANLLSLAALTSPKLGERKIKKGDEIITVAAAFPTTITPIIQYGAVPVFVDVAFPTYNVDCSQLKKALSAKTKVVILAHTLGNPFDLQKIKSFCDKHNLWLIEDNCDALGSKYLFNGEWKYTGTIGHIGTSSFYPPHHITMGEGGAVYTNDIHLKRIIDSFRDWGRDCWCPSGHDNTCKKRFEWQLGKLPYGYDHKYVYSHFGYNLKVTDMQAAIGCAQLDKLPFFIEARKKNWNLLKKGLADLSDKFILPEPTSNSEPSWFGFLLTVKENVGFTRDEIVNYLESHGIQTRMLFAGNLLNHPCFDEIRKTSKDYRVVGNLPNTNIIMKQTFWLGVYPGMRSDMIEFIIDKIWKFADKKNRKQKH